jgi:hypothetical protein
VVAEAHPAENPPICEGEQAVGEQEKGWGRGEGGNEIEGKSSHVASGTEEIDRRHEQPHLRNI